MRAYAAIDLQRVARYLLGRRRKVSVQAFLVSYFLPIFSPFSVTSRTRGLADAAIQDPQLLRTTAYGSSGSRREARYDRPFCVYHPRENSIRTCLPCLPPPRPVITLLSTTSPQHPPLNLSTPPSPPARHSTHARRHKQPRRRNPIHSALKRDASAH
jgi:hypothetical protein